MSKISDDMAYWSRKAYGEETPFKLASIILYEACDISKEQTRLDDYPDEEQIREVNIKTAVGDVLAMTQLYCSRKGLDFYTEYMNGCSRAIERCKEKRQGKGGF